MPASAWPSATSWPTGGGTAWPIPAFPATVVPAAWFDGRQAMFTDLAGTLPAKIGDPVGQVTEASPLVSNWQAQSLAQRGLKDASGAHIDYNGGASSQCLIRAATVATDTTNCTLAVSFLARDASQSPQVGILRAAGFGGIFSGNGALALTYINQTTNWVPTLPLYTKGSRVTAVFRITATALKVLALIDGQQFTDALSTAVTGAAVANPFGIGMPFGADTGFYGSMAQAQVINRAITDSEALALALWNDAQQAPVAYPADAPLFAICGDSIARGNPGGGSQSWAWVALENLRSTYPSCEVLNAAVGGSGTAAAMYTPILPFYLASRTKNVAVLAAGTNDLANANGTDYVINNLFAAYDALLAAGWRPVIMTILDRTGSISIPQATFDAQRATVNAAILASGRRFGDLTGVAGISANGASAGANFIGDGIHPGATGHALYEPVARTAMLAAAT